MTYSASEMMTVAAARALTDDDICFVGIGLPSAACNLARLTHAPRLTLVYESGTLETKPHGAAAVDRRRRAVRDRADDGVGAGDVPVLAAGRPDHRRVPRRRAGRSLRQSEQHGHRRLRQAQGATAGQRRRHRDRHRPAGASTSSCDTAAKSFVERLDFLTSLGHGPTGRERRALGLQTEGPSLIVTDLCTMRPDAEIEGVRGGDAAPRGDGRTAFARTPAGRSGLRADVRRDARADRPRNWPRSAI